MTAGLPLLDFTRILPVLGNADLNPSFCCLGVSIFCAGSGDPRTTQGDPRATQVERGWPSAWDVLEEDEIELLELLAEDVVGF